MKGLITILLATRIFFKRKKKIFFAEDADVGGLKGTARKPFEEVLSEGKKYIWRVDPFRAATIEEEFYQKKFPDFAEDLMRKTQVVYIGVNNLTVLKDRFINRDREQYNKNDLLARIRKDWEVWNMYKEKFRSGPPFYTIINDKTEEAMTEEVLQIIQSS